MFFIFIIFLSTLQLKVKELRRALIELNKRTTLKENIYACFERKASETRTLKTHLDMKNFITPSTRVAHFILMFYPEHHPLQAWPANATTYPKLAIILD